MGSRRHVPVLASAILAVIAVAVVVAMPGDDAHDFSAKASAICERTQSSLSEQNNTPGSIAEALEIEHAAIATYRQEILELQALAPQGAAAFRAGLADDQMLLARFSAMVARPDFIRLSLILPKHPELMPTWLREWLARSHVLLSDARAQFSRAGMPACGKSLG